jgi:hypothetical protein
MGIDLADVFVILKPRSEWTTARSKAELIEKMDAVPSGPGGVVRGACCDRKTRSVRLLGRLPPPRLQ